MSMNQPLVTVWLPTCNRLSLLKRAVDSVLSQSYENIELFIVDNGSTDGTSEYLTQLALDHNNVKYHCFSENKGACAARNFAILNGTGLLATGLDDDDEFLPNRVESLVASFEPEFSFVCSSYAWDYGKYRKHLLNTNKVIELGSQLNFNQASNQVLTYRKRLIEVNMFDVDIISSQDWDIWTRLIITFGKAKRIAEPSYIVHTAHDKPRITDSLNNKVKGLEQFYSRYKHHMTDENKKCFAFLLHYSRGDKIRLNDVKRFFCKPIAYKLCKAWLASQFPSLAKKRLNYLKKDI